MKDKDECRITALWQDLKDGNEQAFRAIICAYRPKLLLLSYYIISNIQEAEDVVQDVFLEFWRLKEKIDLHTTLEGYLSKAVKNASLTKVRKRQVQQKRHSKYSYHIEPYSSCNPLENAELGLQLKRAIESLPPSPRRIFTSMYLEGKSQKQIVNEQKIELQTVKNNISIALKTLRHKLQILTK